ncbi:GNAT family N-acetyltransferase [Limnobacter sp.]|uniref:GNAT family N-acetyltransferase n=1 Tax=Limnobacter sp. TaxID=2003368 RepID=UPI003513829F
MELKPYEPSDSTRWDEFVNRARNGTLLHKRGFMDYHAHRFEDCSLLAFNSKRQLVAVLPANRVADEVQTHGGLTFGGLLVDQNVGQTQCLRLFEEMTRHYAQRGARTLLYKPVPRVFHRTACEDDLYALSRMGAQLVRRDASTVVDLANRPKWGKGRQWIINKGRKTGVEIRAMTDPAPFLALLENTLARHGAKPVHSTHEMMLLMQRFEEEIRLFGAFLDGQLMAGCWIFDFGRAVHTQYLANSPLGRDFGALDCLIAELIEHEYAHRNWLSFGISTEQEGHVLNEGLVAFKESYGGHTMVNDFYRLNLT